MGDPPLPRRSSIFKVSLFFSFFVCKYICCARIAARHKIIDACREQGPPSALVEFLKKKYLSIFLVSTPIIDSPRVLKPNMGFVQFGECQIQMSKFNKFGPKWNTKVGLHTTTQTF